MITLQYPDYLPVPGLALQQVLLRHEDTAYERFTETGPLALLPHSEQRCVLVFTVAANETEKYLQMDVQSFLDALLERFGRRLGKFSKLGQRKSYPLKMLQVKEQVKHRAVILGNAAHVVHPNGAQRAQHSPISLHAVLWSLP